MMELQPLTLQRMRQTLRYNFENNDEFTLIEALQHPQYKDIRKFNNDFTFLYLKISKDSEPSLNKNFILYNEDYYAFCSIPFESRRYKNDWHIYIGKRWVTFLMPQDHFETVRFSLEQATMVVSYLSTDGEPVRLKV